MRVLIVDDNDAELAVLDHVLRSAGYEVERAANGREVLTAVQTGCRLHPAAAYLRMARDIAAAHHERYDGSGYPRGLSAREIPLSARIVALADVYDALAAKRDYKDAFEHMHARAIIEGDAGKQFDPVVAGSLVDREPESLRILSAFNESVAVAA